MIANVDPSSSAIARPPFPQHLSPAVPRVWRVDKHFGRNLVRGRVDSICANFVNRCSALEYAGSPQRAATKLFETHAWSAGRSVNQDHVGKGHTSWAVKWVGLGLRRLVVLDCRLYTPKRRQVLYKLCDGTGPLDTTIRVLSRK
jgi:hypothetical protein